MRPLAVLLAVAGAACGCGSGEPGDALVVTDMTVYEPVPGSTAAVAYFTLRNEGAAPILLRGVSSPEFGSVEMHATVVEDGIASMLPIDALTIAGESEVEFTTGDRHLMLMDRRSSAALGGPVRLLFHYDNAGSGGVLTVEAPLQERGPGGD